MRSAEEKKKEPLERNSGGMNARKDRNIGDALRSVYSDAVDEKIPDDLLDLLGKLD
ncbi:NepR family anti-sigma factor [Sphingomonas turrisvirgatae]|uniref:NepR family anti-sigma factor n=1 Tax=Sphingomonas turrisvirgatae TaxID=1888892 RepID=UPI001F4ECFBF|nr:NepR family anti-sigma factor [Sphingomonas turrisvirgatae]